MARVELVVEAKEDNIPSWANIIQPMESCDPVEILWEEKIRRAENKQDLVNGLDATTQPRIHPKYEVVKMKLRLKTLVPLANKNPSLR